MRYIVYFREGLYFGRADIRCVRFVAFLFKKIYNKIKKSVNFYKIKLFYN